MFKMSDNTNIVNKSKAVPIEAGVNVKTRSKPHRMGVVLEAIGFTNGWWSFLMTSLIQNGNQHSF